MLLNQLPVDIFLKPHLYLDPGSGSLITQGLIALLLAGGLFLKAFWRKIFHKKTIKEDANAEENTEIDPRKDDNG